MTSIINSTVPEFKVQAYHNGKFVTVTNEDLKGKWAIFFFYPADFTFVCPTELVDMVDKYDRFKAMGVEIYSVSTDTHFVHKAWHDTSESIRKITYPMLADPTGVLSRAIGVMDEERNPVYPAVPPSKEQGYDITYYTPRGMAAPLGVDDAIMTRLEAACAAAIEDPAFVTFMNNNGQAISYLDAQGYADYLKQAATDVAAAMDAVGL